MAGMSFSAHISNKKSGITSKTKLEGVAKHNLRKYKSSNYSSENIVVLQGTHNLVCDVKAVYHQEFDAALKDYNDRQKREDRKIPDYFEHVANKEQDMAVEIIIQLGDREFWKENEFRKIYMKRLYGYLLDELKRLFPNFIVANAVVHLDEDSPHMHVVGVPVAYGYTRGLSKQVSKRWVFTPETLSTLLQGKLRAYANRMVDIWFHEEIKEKAKGRNHDLTVAEYKVAKETEKYEQIKKECVNTEKEVKALKEEAVYTQKAVEALKEVGVYTKKEVEVLKEQATDTTKELKVLKEKAADTKKEVEVLKEQAIEAEERAEQARLVYELIKYESEDSLRARCIDAIVENQQLKEDNAKLRESLRKAYDFMEKMVIDGKNMLEKFRESLSGITERVVEKIRDDRKYIR